MARNQICSESKGDKDIKLTVYFVKKLTTTCISLWQNALKVEREDPRRVVHALKVGIALTLVSFLYLLEPLFKGVGENAMWAVITVVVVLEFTAGEFVTF